MVSSSLHVLSREAVRLLTERIFNHDSPVLLIDELPKLRIHFENLDLDGVQWTRPSFFTSFPRRLLPEYDDFIKGRPLDDGYPGLAFQQDHGYASHIRYCSYHLDSYFTDYADHVWSANYPNAVDWDSSGDTSFSKLHEFNEYGVNFSCFGVRIPTDSVSPHIKLKIDTNMADILLEHGADVMALADARALMNDWTRGEDMHEWNYYVGEDDPPLEDVYPLHCAAINWNINIAAKLLAAGADIHSRTSIKGSTALHLAATRFMLEMIQFLIKSGVDYSLADCGGRTMVHHLAFVRRHEMDRVRKFLVELGIYDASMEEEFGFLRLSPMMTDYYGTNDFGRIGL